MALPGGRRRGRRRRSSRTASTTISATCRCRTRRRCARRRSARGRRRRPRLGGAAFRAARRARHRPSAQARALPVRAREAHPAHPQKGGRRPACSGPSASPQATAEELEAHEEGGRGGDETTTGGRGRRLGREPAARRSAQSIIATSLSLGRPAQEGVSSSRKTACKPGLAKEAQQLLETVGAIVASSPARAGDVAGAAANLKN
jgi:hypothetical protein